MIVRNIYAFEGVVPGIGWWGNAGKAAHKTRQEAWLAGADDAHRAVANEMVERSNQWRSPTR